MGAADDPDQACAPSITASSANTAAAKPKSPKKASRGQPLAAADGADSAHAPSTTTSAGAATAKPKPPKPPKAVGRPVADKHCTRVVMGVDNSSGQSTKSRSHAATELTNTNAKR